MYNQTLLLKLLETEQSRHKTLLDALNQRQKELPQGFLSYKNGYPYRVVQAHGKRHQIAISQEVPDRGALIQQLKERRCISKGIPILERNQKCCETFLAQFQTYNPEAIRHSLPAHYSDTELFRLRLALDIDPAQWARASYRHNTAFPDNLKYHSEGGLATRSKAEADIATKLEQNHLIFRYEPELKLGKHIWYPDFCILHPVLRRLIYWEHFGMMGNPEYAHKTMEKLRVFSEHGYILGDNLIMTWESETNPLQFKHINDRIKLYLS